MSEFGERVVGRELVTSIDGKHLHVTCVESGEFWYNLVDLRDILGIKTESVLFDVDTVRRVADVTWVNRVGLGRLLRSVDGRSETAKFITWYFSTNDTDTKQIVLGAME